MSVLPITQVKRKTGPLAGSVHRMLLPDSGFIPRRRAHRPRPKARRPAQAHPLEQHDQRHSWEGSASADGLAARIPVAEEATNQRTPLPGG
jgi:hypothetical protein